MKLTLTNQIIHVLLISKTIIIITQKSLKHDKIKIFINMHSVSKPFFFRFLVRELIAEMAKLTAITRRAAPPVKAIRRLFLFSLFSLSDAIFLTVDIAHPLELLFLLYLRQMPNAREICENKQKGGLQWTVFSWVLFLF